MQAGAADLDDAIAEHPDEHLVIFGSSQGAGRCERGEAQARRAVPDRNRGPDIDFVLVSDPNLPNGGLASRFPGLYIPILDLSFNGPAPTDTQFDTVEIIRQYDGAADLPLYPLNLVADLNALLGFFYLPHAPDRRQPGSRCVDVAGFPGHPWGHQLLHLPNRGPAVVRSAAPTGGARVVDRCGRAVLPGAGGTGL